MRLAQELQRRWYAVGESPPWWTLPLARLYRAVTALHRGLQAHGMARVERLSVPVVVVGNLVAGGAGKTPLTIALVLALRARGFRPGVVSRGYGGSARAPCVLGPDPDPAVTGDEPALIHARTGAPVAIGRARAAAARLLLPEGVDVVVADDGLQHLALARDVEICVVDGIRRFGNGRLLPAGPLREPTARLATIDFVVCNGGDPQPGEIPMRLQPDDAMAVGDQRRDRALSCFAGQRVHAVAGIGNPARFFESLRASGVDLLEHPFPDHHRYEPADLAFGDDLPVLMTEKDAVKCRAFARRGWWQVPVTATLPQSFLGEVAQRVRQAGAAGRSRRC